jgi:cyclopropane fatty-acyl-phospholipid synthase-like methyltransferase
MAEAQDRMTDLFVERVGLQPGERLLDVGCGTGAPAARAVQAVGCRVAGITISRAQAVRARDLERSDGLRGRLAFLMSEALALPFRDGSFHGAWALESIFHMGDRLAVLREIARVLRPGGRLVFTDLVEVQLLDRRQRGIVRALQIASLARRDEYRGWFEDAGFEGLEIEDLSDRVRRSVGATQTAMEARRSELVAAYGEELYTTMWRLQPELEALHRDKLSYVLVAGRRAASGVRQR